MTDHTKNLLLDTLDKMIADNKIGHCIESRLTMVRDFIQWEKAEPRPNYTTLERSDTDQQYATWLANR